MNATKKLAKETQNRHITISEFEDRYGLHFTREHTGKMKGVMSISTACPDNPYCINRRNLKGTICEFCYAFQMTKRYKNMLPCLRKNTEVLTTTIIPKKDMPFLFSETGYFRFESFGDLINEIQVVNYFNMASANRHMKCALWTKNPWIIASAIRKYGIKKPRNLTIVFSSYYLNEQMKVSETYDFIDKVFTVYDKKFAKKAGIEINCGGRKCADCGRCYENYGGKVVNELKK